MKKNPGRKERRNLARRERRAEGRIRSIDNEIMQAIDKSRRNRKH